jgi:hypothetical protein
VRVVWVFWCVGVGQGVSVASHAGVPGKQPPAPGPIVAATCPARPVKMDSWVCRLQKLAE